MAYLKIYCDYCSQTWDVYKRSMKDNHSRVCPHCGSEIDEQTWNRQIVPALCMVSDANQELVKDHLGYHKPIFQFDVIEDTYFSKDGQAVTTQMRDDLEEVKEDIQDIKSIIGELNYKTGEHYLDIVSIGLARRENTNE